MRQPFAFSVDPADLLDEEAPEQDDGPSEKDEPDERVREHGAPEGEAPHQVNGEV
ncbi:hypothetical protein [Micromonospora musae]|uniref:hypothetical protein n=1 Tax=Micromonospora musae TaxID=1894970 RepID=UPI0033E53578